MRRGAFDYAAKELNLPRHLWDKVYREVKHTDQLTRLIWEVDAQNKKSLIAVCRVWGAGSQERYTVRHKTRRVKIPLSWRITMSEEQPRKDKLVAMWLRDGNKGIGLEEALAEYFRDFYTDPYKRADAIASMMVARRQEVAQDAMNEMFWAGIFYAKKHPEKVIIEEQDTPPERQHTSSYVS